MTRREREERPVPAHPYRDSAIVYGIMAVLLVVLAGVTGGSLLRATAAGAVFFLVATAWSSWKFRGRIRQRDAREAAAVADPARDPVQGSGLSEGGSTAGSGNGTEDAVGDGTGNGRGRAKP